MSMSADNLFQVLAESNRRKIMDYMRDRERSVGELVELTSLSQPNVSKHLKILREAGLVRVRKAGQSHYYRLNPKPLQEMDDWFEPYRRFWSDKLDQLEKQLDE